MPPIISMKKRSKRLLYRASMCWIPRSTTALSAASALLARELRAGHARRTPIVADMSRHPTLRYSPQSACCNACPWRRGHRCGTGHAGAFLRCGATWPHIVSLLCPTADLPAVCAEREAPKYSRRSRQTRAASSHVHLIRLVSYLYTYIST